MGRKKILLTEEDKKRAKSINNKKYYEKHRDDIRLKRNPQRGYNITITIDEFKEFKAYKEKTKQGADKIVDDLICL
jgi:hypothetical protein